MDATIRDRIIDRFKMAKAPESLDKIAQKLGLSRSSVEHQMSTTSLLSDFRGLTPDQALKLIEFYGEGVIFDRSLERVAREFQVTKDKIKDIERRSRGRE